MWWKIKEGKKLGKENIKEKIIISKAMRLRAGVTEPGQSAGFRVEPFS